MRKTYNLGPGRILIEKENEMEEQKEEILNGSRLREFIGGLAHELAAVAALRRFSPVHKVRKTKPKPPVNRDKVKAARKQAKKARK